jgi:hypothetical protein
MIGLPVTGDRQGGGGVTCVSAGMVSGNGRIQEVQPNPITDQRFAPCPSNLMNFPGKIPGTWKKQTSSFFVCLMQIRSRSFFS